MSFTFRMVHPPADDADYQPQVGDAPDCYQVNNQGVRILDNAMSAAGLLDEECESPDFDATIPDGIDEERFEQIVDALEFGDEPDPPLTDVERRAIEQARKDQELLLAVQSPNSGHSPGFKFGSNDGWIITPEECAAIGVAMAELMADPDQLAEICPTDESKAVIESWCEFVRVAGPAGGFVVH